MQVWIPLWKFLAAPVSDGAAMQPIADCHKLHVVVLITA